MHMQKSRLYTDIWQQLEKVIDPEMYISIVDLGLVYTVTQDQAHIDIQMTLTSLGCPLFPVIERDIESKLLEIDGVDSVKISLTFDPPWSTDRMTEKGKAILGI